MNDTFSTLMSISTLGGVSVGTFQFNAPNYTFDAPDGLRINVNGVNASLANAPTFNVIGTPGHSTPAINFNNFSSAGTAQIILGQTIDTNNGFNAGFINFNGNSTAGRATITVRDQSATIFNNSVTSRLIAAAEDTAAATSLKTTDHPFAKN